jgi:transcriptional regulator with XRE-family HTH domain
MNIKSDLGANVRFYRKRLHLSQEELSERLDIGNKHLSDIETGQAFVSAELLDRLCNELGVTASALFYNNEEKFPSDDTLGHITGLIESELQAAMRNLNERIRRGEGLTMTGS